MDGKRRGSRGRNELVVANQDFVCLYFIVQIVLKHVLIYEKLKKSYDLTIFEGFHIQIEDTHPFQQKILVSALLLH